MEIEFDNASLEQLATDTGFQMGLPSHVAQKYRDRIALIVAAVDERAFRALQGSLDYKKINGGNGDERQMRLNNQYRVRLRIIDNGDGKTVRIIGVGDFHD